MDTSTLMLAELEHINQNIQVMIVGIAILTFIGMFWSAYKLSWGKK